MMKEINPPYELSFEKVMAALLDFDTPFPPQYLHRFSDLVGDEFVQFKAAWPALPDWRRKGLLEDLEQMFEADTLLSFEAICRLALLDAHPKVRFIALRSLQDYNVEDLIPQFIQFLNTDSDHEIRALAASALGQYIYLGELEELSKSILETIEVGLLQAAINGKTSLIRRRAIESLGFSSRQEVPGLIESAFNTQDEEWIASALLAMGRTYDSRWKATVLKMLDHRSPKIRYEAVRAAGELEISAAREPLIVMLGEDDREVVLATVWALSQIGGEELEQIFENILKETESDEEAELIEEALDNLLFNESIGLHDSFDLDDDIDF